MKTYTEVHLGTKGPAVELDDGLDSWYMKGVAYTSEDLDSMMQPDNVSLQPETNSDI